MRVTLNLQQGPMAGRKKDVEVGPPPQGKLVIGRDPGAEGLMLEGDSTVSRRHLEILQQRGDLLLNNLSSNGTAVDGEIVLGQRMLTPGVLLGLGTHVVEVQFSAVVTRRSASRSEGPNSATMRPRMSPLIKAVLGVYLLGLVGLGVFLAGRGGEAMTSTYAAAREEYSTRYAVAHSMAQGDLERRLNEADQLVVELMGHLRSERWQLAEDTCRQLMDLDRDVHSPMYRFALRSLGELAEKH